MLRELPVAPRPRLFTCLLILAILFLGIPVGAQEGATEWVVQEVLFHSRAYDLLRQLSDQIGGRISTSPQAEEAVKWAEEQFRLGGATDVHREAFTMVGWEQTSLSAQIAEAKRSLHLTPYVATPSFDVSTTVADLNEGTANAFDSQKEPLRGKILLVGSGIPPKDLEEYLSAFVAVPAIVERAVEAGAAAIFFVHFQPGQIRYQTTALNDRAAPLPIFRITREDGLWLRRRLQTGHPTTVQVQYVSRLVPQGTSWNVVGEILGEEKPDEIVLVGAHLDSIGPGQGALDNGAGSAAVLDLARILGQSKAFRPRRTIRFVLFTGEEEGLVGSNRYVNAHRDELDRIVAMVNMDTGAGRVIAYEYAGRPDVRKRIDKFVELFGPLGPREVQAGQTWYSDHGPFVRAGVPAIFLLQDTAEYEPYIHTQADSFDKVSPDNYRAACAVLAGTVVEIANMPERFAGRWTREEIHNLLRQTGEIKNLEALRLRYWSLDEE